MIYCNSCEQFFDEENAIKEANTVPYGLGVVQESTITLCPHCKSDNLRFDETPHTCVRCGKLLLEEQIAAVDSDGDDVCHDCVSIWDFIEKD